VFEGILEEHGGRAYCLTSGFRVDRVVSGKRASAVSGLEETMTKVIPAIFEGGALRPLQSLNLGEKEHVFVLLLPEEPAKIVETQRAALAELIGIGKSMETEVSVRHDEFLYPRPQ
jgi:predicted DNA-binding antitoxin AbrB/MazE fold protein